MRQRTRKVREGRLALMRGDQNVQEKRRKNMGEGDTQGATF